MVYIDCQEYRSTGWPLYSVTTPPWPLVLINFLNKFLTGDSSSGFRRGISHFFMAARIQPREWEKKNKEQTINKGLEQLKYLKVGSVTLHSLCICRLTLTCILREISTKPPGMLTHLDWSSLIAPGLSHADWSLLLSGVTYTSTSPFANSFSGIPLPTSGRVEISSSGLCLVSLQNKQ